VRRAQIDASYLAPVDSGYLGANAVGTKIVFGPSAHNNVGIFDVVAESFLTVATTGDAAMGSNKYSGGAVVVGGAGKGGGAHYHVIFSPSTQTNVGIFGVRP